jgi:hypothetical protein
MLPAMGLDRACFCRGEEFPLKMRPLRYEPCMGGRKDQSSQRAPREDC